MDREDSVQKIFALAHEVIDTDLDGRLDAVVLYSGNVSHRSEKDDRRPNERNSACRGNQSSAFDLTQADLSKQNSRFQNCSKETPSDELNDYVWHKWKNTPFAELGLSGSETDFEEIYNDRESLELFLRKSIYEETVSEFYDDRKADSRRDKKSSLSNIMKQTSWQSKFDFDEELGDAAVSFESNVANTSVEEPNESSDVKIEEPEKINSFEKAPKISLFGTSTFIPEKYSDASVTPKPEEVPMESRFARIDSIDKYSAEVTCAHERNFDDHCEIIETHLPPSFPVVVEMTSSSSSDYESWRETNEKKVEKPVAVECINVVTINDSEDSICEIPVPQKPEPLTVYLEDSSNSTASSSDTEYLETASARKSSPSICIGDTVLGDTLESRCGTSEGEKEFESHVMGSEMSMNKYLPSLSDADSSKPEGSESLSRDFSLKSSSASSSGNPRSCKAVEKVGKTVAEECPGSSQHSEVGSREMEISPRMTKLCDAAGIFLSAIRQAVLENNDRQKNYGGETGQTFTDDGALMLNVAEVDRSADLVDNGEGETRTKTREYRKRSIIDRENKSSQSSLAKRARNPDDRAEATTSRGKSSKENTENFLSAIRQAVPENNDRQKNYGGETGQTFTDDGALILNVAEVNRSPDLVDNGEGETRTKTREYRKRSIIDRGNKSSQSYLAKRARNSDDRAEAATSSGKSSKENENRDKTRNCAADYFFQPMSNEMKDFYNNSWGGENFDVDALRRQMPRDPRQWSISNEDLLGRSPRRPRYWAKMKSRNCNESGHSVAPCRQEKKVPSCHMCGVSGHREPRCPHKQCLGCGRKQKTYMQVCNGCSKVSCSGCQSLGHEVDSCPDLWRRYHLTTSITDVNTDLRSADVMKPQHLLSCCNCANRGHDSANCISYRWSHHFPTPAHVTNYTTGPFYENDFAPEVESLSSYEVDGRSIVETQATDGVSSLQATPKRSHDKHEKKKRDKKTNERPVVDPNVGKLEETMERSENRIQAGKSRESLMANSEPTENRNVAASLKFESKLLTQASEDSDDFGVCQVFLTAPQLYENFADCDLTRRFMTNLTRQFPVNIEIVRAKKGRMELFISSNKAFHSGTSQLIRDWLKYPVDERDRFIDFKLPTKKKTLVKLIASKLDELDEDLGDPIDLSRKVQMFNSQLRTIQLRMDTGKKFRWARKHTRLVCDLANSQCRLNMILFGRTKDGVPSESQEYLRKTLFEMQHDNSSSKVHPSKYLQILAHYNKIFAAYTPDNLKFLVQQCKEAAKGKGKATRLRFRGFKNKSLTNKKVNPNRDTNPSSSSISPRVSSGKTDEGSRRYFNCNVENPFQPHSPILNDKNREPDTNLHRPKPQIETQDNSAKGANNYYRSKYDFGNSSKYRTHRESAVPKNLEQNDYIPLDSGLGDSEKMPDNRYGDLSSESRPFDLHEGVPRDNRNEEANVGIGKVFYFEERTGSSQDFGRNSGGVFPGTEVASTKVDRKPRDTGRRTNERNITDEKRKKMHKFARLPSDLQERIAARVDEYSNLGDHNILQAINSIQSHAKKNSLRLFHVDKFEKSLKRVTGIADRLM